MSSEQSQVIYIAVKHPAVTDPSIPAEERNGNLAALIENQALDLFDGATLIVDYGIRTIELAL